MISTQSNLLSQTRGILRSSLPFLFAAVLPLSAAASVSASLSWAADPDPYVTGYNIYYGTVSHQYTNVVSVGLTTNVIISGLIENMTYFFAAKSHDSVGDESGFSSESAFEGVTTLPGSSLHQRTTPNGLYDSLNFSLDATAPSGATINQTNGIFSWVPGRASASTTNYVGVQVTDLINPALSIYETLAVTVGNFVEFRVGSIASSAGQTSSLPITVANSGTVTNLQITLNWPGNNLSNPTITVLPPVVSSSIQNQNNQLLIQLQTAPNQPLTGTNQVAQVNFQAAAGQNSAIFSIPATAGAGQTADGLATTNLPANPGEIVVVGANPLLRPQTDANGGRSLSLFANTGSYQLQYTTSLAPPVNWTTMTTYQQTNLAQSVSITPAGPSTFYRLQQL